MKPSEEKNDRIVYLENYISEVERFQDKLNSVVIAQGKKISDLQRDIDLLKSRLEDFNYEITNNKPPHY